VSSPEANYPPIESERLLLVWMSPSFIRASLDGDRDAAAKVIGASVPEGWPDDGLRRRMGTRLAQMERQPEAAPWLLRAMVTRADNEVVGYINFHGAPEDGRAELGYTVIDPHRRHGYASESALAMMRWAKEEHGVETFVLSISPDNDTSLAMAERLGFRQVGTRMDDVDGEELVFERPA
jgi:ribosomal-protein-alanine N-acetyltransferase